MREVSPGQYHGAVASVATKGRSSQRGTHRPSSATTENRKAIQRIVRWVTRSEGWTPAKKNVKASMVGASGGYSACAKTFQSSASSPWKWWMISAFGIQKLVASESRDASQATFDATAAALTTATTISPPLSQHAAAASGWRGWTTGLGGGPSGSAVRPSQRKIPIWAATITRITGRL